MSFSGTKGYITNPKPGVMLNPLHPLSRGLVGYWLFNEGAGSLANDISGHNNHGRLTNMAPNAQDSGWGGSKFGGGLQSDGVDDYVNCGNDSSLDITDAITISAWVKTSSTLGQFVGKSNIANDAGWVAEVRAGYFGFGVKKNSSNYWLQRGNILVNDNVFHHLTAVYYGNGDIPTLYVDGNIQTLTDVVTAGDALNGFTDSGENLEVGRNHGFASVYRYFNGSTDSVRIYNCVLSAEELKTLFHDPFCNLLQIPIRRYSVIAPVGAIMNQFQRANIGADLYNGVFA